MIFLQFFLLLFRLLCAGIEILIRAHQLVNHILILKFQTTDNFLKFLNLFLMTLHLFIFDFIFVLTVNQILNLTPFCHSLPIFNLFHLFFHALNLLILRKNDLLWLDSLLCKDLQLLSNKANDLFWLHSLFLQTLQFLRIFFDHLSFSIDFYLLVFNLSWQLLDGLDTWLKVLCYFPLIIRERTDLLQMLLFNLLLFQHGRLFLFA